MTHRNNKEGGFTLIEIMITVLLIGLLASIAIPNFIRSRTTAQTNVCINNLRTIDYAIQQWALEQKKAANAPVQFSDISAYLKNSVTCPAGGVSFADSYSISAVGSEPSCQRVPSAHLIDQATAIVVSLSTTPSGTGQPSPGNNGNGNANAYGNGNGNGNGNQGNGNGNEP